MRTFISIKLPESVKANFFHSFEKLANLGLVGGNFVSKDNLHLTLNFLGVLSNEEIDLVKESLKKVYFSSFEVEVGDVGFFPSLKHINTIWVGLNSFLLDELNQIIFDVLKDTGVSIESKPFIPHVTCVRVKSISDKDLFFDKIESLKIKNDSFLVDKFYLMKSELTSSGPIYKELENFPLKE